MVNKDMMQQSGSWT